MNITITTEQIKAVSVFAAVKDVRYYLQAVCFTCHGENTLAIATDGHCLGVLNLGEQDEPPTGEILIPVEALLLAAKAAGRNSKIPITEDRAGSVVYVPVDAKYPDWTRILPKTCSGETAQIDPSILAKFVKARTALGKSGFITIAHNGLSAALVDIGHEQFVGVAMPMRVDCLPTLPEWLAVAA